MEKMEVLMQDVAQEEGYETKYVPTADLAYDLYNGKKSSECSLACARQNFYAQSANKGFDETDFAGFIAKTLREGSFNSAFSIKSTVDFFANVPDFYNPFRLVSTCVKTSADSVEVPGLGTIATGWNNVTDANIARAASNAVLVRSFPIFTKMELPLHFLHRVEHTNYVKALLGMQRSRLERRAFVNGDGRTEPLGILIDPKLNKKDVHGYADGNALADGILEQVFALTSEFKHDACFMISSSMQAKIARVKDQTGRYIFDNKELFGYKVYTLDELKDSDDISGKHDTILFGNFKYGHLICDSNESELRLHDLFDKPNTIGLSMPANCGAALVCPEAIIAIDTIEA